MKKIIKGHKNTKGESVAGLGGNLKYYVCDFVEAEATYRNKRAPVSESTEMLCSRGKSYELVKDNKDFKIVRNKDNYVGIIFYEDAIAGYEKAIGDINWHFVTYVFSLGDDPHETQLEDVKDEGTLCAIPEIILKVYRQIVK